MPLLLLALVLVPVIEIALFIEIGRAIGTLPTIAALIASAVIGAVLLGTQGSGLMTKARSALARGEMPVAEVVHGLFLMIAGVLFLIPGFFTDALGLLLCIPPLRLALGRAVLRGMRKRIDVQVTRFRGRRDPKSEDDQPPPPPDGPGSDGAGGASKWRPPENPRDPGRD